MYRIPHLLMFYKLLSWGLGGREGFVAPRGWVLCESVWCLLLRLSTDFLKSEVHFKALILLLALGRRTWREACRARISRHVRNRDGRCTDNPGDGCGTLAEAASQPGPCRALPLQNSEERAPQHANTGTPSSWRKEGAVTRDSGFLEVVVMSWHCAARGCVGRNAS